MSDEVDRLWTLHGLDEEAGGLRSVLARFPEQRRELEQRVAEAKARLEQGKVRLAELQKGRRDLERQAGELVEQERRFANQLLSVKKNEEYTALLHEIEATKRKRSDLSKHASMRTLKPLWISYLPAPGG